MAVGSATANAIAPALAPAPAPAPAATAAVPAAAAAAATAAVGAAAAAGARAVSVPAPASAATLAPVSAPAAPGQTGVASWAVSVKRFKVNQSCCSRACKGPIEVGDLRVRSALDQRAQRWFHPGCVAGGLGPPASVQGVAALKDAQNGSLRDSCDEPSSGRTKEAFVAATRAAPSGTGVTVGSLLSRLRRTGSRRRWAPKALRQGPRDWPTWPGLTESSMSPSRPGSQLPGWYPGGRSMLLPGSRGPS